MKNIINKVVREMAEKQLRHEDEFICFMFYQPKLPDGYQRVINRKKY